MKLTTLNTYFVPKETHLIFTTDESITTNICILQMSQLRHSEFRYLPKVTHKKWSSQNLNIIWLRARFSVTSSPIVLNESDSTSQETLSNAWRHFWLSQLRSEVLLVSGGRNQRCCYRTSPTVHRTALLPPNMHREWSYPKGQEFQDQKTMP